MATLLIVDDNKKNLQVLGNILSGEKNKVAMALDGITAIKLAEKIIPDLIILDIMMPGIDGYEVCQKLKKIEKLKNIPIIFLTAKIDVDDIVKAFKVGGADYITKPFKKEELLARINNQIELVNSKKKIEEQSLQLQADNQFKNRMFSIIGHDLRGSISMIKMSIDLLLESKISLDEINYKKLLSKLSSSTEETYNLLDNLLYWGKSESGSLDVNLETIDMSRLINNTLSLLSLNIGHKNIKIENKVGKETKVHADLQMIQTVFRNLLSNGIKFCRDRGTITISSYAQNNMVEFSVKDNGVGISEEDMKKILSKEGQFKTLGTNSEKGTGLGLILCQDFILKNNGSFKVESELGQGSIFSFTLPVVG